MDSRVISGYAWSGFLMVLMISLNDATTGFNKAAFKEQTLEMFKHAYWSYMNYAYPADELMPLSCKGRYRGVTLTRGDVDDALGNFSLTLIDTLDSLVVLGMYSEFEEAVSNVINDVKFTADVAVSVFETNIRVVGGLLGGHLMAKTLQQKQKHRMPWYTDQLLMMAKDVAERLLPAFNTTSGVPYPRVNLRRGLTDALKKSHDTCTACAGTMILEFAALSRLTGEPEFEEKARKAMDFLWQQRHRGSDLMGTVLNVHNGDWIRRDAGIGAGIDSYYEYCLKAYILLGDFSYLHRFNKHYDGVMRYISQGPVFVDVHMHKPTVASRSFMDSLLAFWPGLQVLKGDLKPAIETHEMLYQVMQKHNFLPEAFTHDFQVHWGQHPLRPEFVESTYFLYRATKDPHYLEVGAKVIESMNKHVRTPCGFAGVKDVRTMAHEDRMDSFVLAETFKYLYMLFAEQEELILDPDNYIFTTEAHLLPLSIAQSRFHREEPPKVPLSPQEKADRQELNYHSCPNTRWTYNGDMSSYGRLLRDKLKNLVSHSQPGLKLCPAKSNKERLKAKDFTATNAQHMEALQRMGISMVSQADGRVQLMHSAASAATPKDAQDGLAFMQEMIVLSQNQENEGPQAFRVVQFVSEPHFGETAFMASPAHFGKNLTGSFMGTRGHVVVAEPFRACTPLRNQAAVRGNIVVAERSDCMFVEKALNAENAGAKAIVIIDHTENTNSVRSPLFAMSGDGKNLVEIPAVFLFREEGEYLLNILKYDPALEIRIGEKIINPDYFLTQFLQGPKVYQKSRSCPGVSQWTESLFVTVNSDGKTCVREGLDGHCFTETELLEPSSENLGDFVTYPVLLEEESGTETKILEKNCVTEGRKTTCVETSGNRKIISVEEAGNIWIESRDPARFGEEVYNGGQGVSSWNLWFFEGKKHRDTPKLRESPSHAGEVPAHGIEEKREYSSFPPILEITNAVESGQKSLDFHFSPYLPPRDLSKLTDRESDAVIDDLVSHVRDQTNIAFLPNAALYLKLVDKLARMSLGQLVRLTDEEQNELAELTMSVTVNEEENRLRGMEAVRKDNEFEEEKMDDAIAQKSSAETGDQAESVNLPREAVNRLKETQPENGVRVRNAVNQIKQIQDIGATEAAAAEASRIKRTASPPQNTESLTINEAAVNKRPQPETMHGDTREENANLNAHP